MSQADDAQPTLKLAPADALPNFASTDNEIRVAAGASSSFVVTIQPVKAKFPGVKLKQPSGDFDLSAYGYVEAHITNTGTESVEVNLRTDNAQHHSL
jgi:hypothetical protein